MAAVLDLSALTQAHEAVAGAALAVACRAEGRNVVGLHQPADDLVKGALIGNVELLGVGGALLFGIAADGGTGCAADLRNAEIDNLRAHLLTLTRGDDHAGVRP